MMIFGLLFIFGLFGLLFWNFRQVAPGVKGSLIAGALIVLTFSGFLLGRDSYFFSCVQMVTVVWIAQALWMFLLWDVFRIGRRIIRRSRISNKMATVGARIVLVASMLLAAIFVAYGIPHNADFKIRTETVEVPWRLSAEEAQGISKEDSAFTANTVRDLHGFKAILFSDLHMDMQASAQKLERLAAVVDSVNPDFVLFAGDLADMHDSALTDRGFDKYFRRMAASAKVGAYAVSGNHEAYMEKSGSDPMGWLRRNGWVALEDSTACTAPVCITGRVDFQVARTRDVPRKPLAGLVPRGEIPHVDVGFILAEDTPWLLLDHQPKGIEAEYTGRLPDFAMSGHTHDGQFFPVTVLINLFWRLSAGFGDLDGVHWLVTNGIDSWGPPVRVGSDTELWILTFKRVLK